MNLENRYQYHEPLFKDFRLSEFDCPCCSANGINLGVISRLQIVRDEIQKPIIINSGYRCSWHNIAIGGEKNSQHLIGNAVDIKLDCYNEKEQHLILQMSLSLFRGIGIYKTFLHLDLAEKRIWVKN